MVYTDKHFKPYIGKWMRFKTTFGEYSGYVQEVRNNAVLVKMPMHYSTRLTNSLKNQSDVQLAGGYYDGWCGRPFWGCGPWFWWWIPFIFIIFIPFFWW